MRNTYLLGVALLAMASLSACAHAPVDPNAPPLTPAQAAAAKAAQKQADFKQVCKYAGGAWQLAKPVAELPGVKAKIGESGVLAVKALDVFVTVTCSGDLDINDADAIIQRGYDIGGKVIALILEQKT